MDSVRERLFEIIKILPEEKLHALLEFANCLLENHQIETDDDVLLMTRSSLFNVITNENTLKLTTGKNPDNPSNPGEHEN